MKRKNQYSDQDIIQLFKQLPKVTDRRNLDEVYSDVKNALDSTHTIHYKRKKYWQFLPVALTVAIFFIVMLIGTNVITNQDNQISTIQKFDGEKKEKISIMTEKEEENKKEFKNKRDLVYLIQDGARGVYQNQLTKRHEIVTLSIPDEHSQNIIPVSFLVEKVGDRTWIDYYNEIMDLVNERTLNLSDYYPYDGKLDIDENGTVELYLYSSHQYDLGSTEETVFFKSFEQFAQYGAKEILIYEEKDPGTYFNHIGSEVHSFKIDNSTKKAYLFYNPSNQKYLSPTPHSFNSIEDAFLAMKEQVESHKLEPSIPRSVEFQIKELENGQLSIRFSEGFSLKEIPESERMIEAILLTAKEFGFHAVQFENTGVMELGMYRFEKPVEVPIAPNLVGILD